MDSRALIEKRIGETPLEALERFRSTRPELRNIPLTYAGRLDPMAEGKLLILIGDECKNKEKYLGLDKEYEIEIVFGIETDTYDALGIAEVTPLKVIPRIHIESYIGRFIQEYPVYSSKTVNGKQLHQLARSRDLPEEMPTKDVEIYLIQLLGQSCIDSEALKAKILEKIALIKGDFRQEEIKDQWNAVLNDSNQVFECLKIRVSCGSGTYMRSLAHRMGKDAGTSAFALSIKRTKIAGL